MVNRQSNSVRQVIAKVVQQTVQEMKIHKSNRNDQYKLSCSLSVTYTKCYLVMKNVTYSKKVVSIIFFKWLPTSTYILPSPNMGN